MGEDFMSRYTAEIPFFIVNGVVSYYHYPLKKFDETEEPEGIYIAKRHCTLTSIVHEINECEITHLLEEKFVEETKGITMITITRKLIKQTTKNFSEEIFDKVNGVNEKAFISHIISPYAKGNCFMPRRNYRVLW